MGLKGNEGADRLKVFLNLIPYFEEGLNLDSFCYNENVTVGKIFNHHTVQPANKTFFSYLVKNSIETDKEIQEMFGAVSEEKAVEEKLKKQLLKSKN